MSGCREIRRRRQDEILSNCGVDFNKLPEDIIAAIMIILITSPHDASRYALVSKLFRSAADSDVVWRRFLPSNYQEIIAGRSNCAPRCGTCPGCLEIEMLNSLSMKQLFFWLKSLLIDGGGKSFELDKRSRKIICKIAARGLIIYFGNEAPYWTWTWIDEQEKRNHTARNLQAYLNFVWTLEIQGKIKMSLLSAKTTYVAYLVFNMTDKNYGFDYPLEASVRIGGIINTQNVNMFTQKEKHRDERSFELEIGEFFINGKQDGDVEMTLSNINANRTKRGLIVRGFEIRPKVVQH